MADQDLELKGCSFTFFIFIVDFLLIFLRNVKNKNNHFSKTQVIFFCTTAQIAHVVFTQNFGAMVLSMTCVATGLLGDNIRNTFNGCPVTVLVGKSGRGGSIARRSFVYG